MTELQDNTIKMTLEAEAVDEWNDSPYFKVEVIDSVGNTPKLVEVEITAVPIAELESLADEWEREDWVTQEANLQARRDAKELRELIQQYRGDGDD